MRFLPLVAAFCALVAGCAPSDERSAPAACRPAPEPAVLTPGDARRAILAGAPDGTAAVAAWESATGGPLRAAVRTADGWTRAIGVSERGASSAAAAAPPGGTVVAWDGWDGDRRAVRVAVRDRDGTWGAPRSAAAPGGVRPRRPVLAPAPSGGALLAWRDDPAGAVRAAFVAPDGVVGPASTVVRVGAIRDVAAVVDAGGRRTVLWIQAGDAGAVVRAATWDGAAWAAPVTLSAPVPVASDLRVAAGRGGHLAAAWRAELGDRRERIGLRLRGPGGAWGPETAAGDVHVRATGLPRPPGPPDVAPAVAVDADGGVLVAWPQQEDLRDRIRVARTAPGGPPTAAPPLPASRASGTPALAFAPDGTAAAVWEDLDGARLTARIALLSPGGDRWTGCRTLGPVGDEVVAPRVAWLEGGPVAAWASSNDGAVLATAAAP